MANISSSSELINSLFFVLIDVSSCIPDTMITVPTLNGVTKQVLFHTSGEERSVVLSAILLIFVSSNWAGDFVSV
ncbi:hypothetical protein QQP08_024443 [Theobroma cacao]|nr:hypothetical protein QQP08_024443 [Theobroma cacao]